MGDWVGGWTCKFGVPMFARNLSETPSQQAFSLKFGANMGWGQTWGALILQIQPPPDLIPHLKPSEDVLFCFEPRSALQRSEGRDPTPSIRTWRGHCLCRHPLAEPLQQKPRMTNNPHRVAKTSWIGQCQPPPLQTPP